MTQHGCESHGNMNPMGMQKNPLPHHAMSNHIKTQNENPTVLNANSENKHNCCETLTSQSNGHDTS